jgi:zinc transporter ZupT
MAFLLVPQVTRKPDEASLAFLLGTAIGVMATVSAVELWIRSALAGHPLLITGAVLAGAAAFCCLEPLLPKEPELVQEPQERASSTATGSSTGTAGSTEDMYMVRGSSRGTWVCKVQGRGQVMVGLCSI